MQKKRVKQKQERNPVETKARILRKSTTLFAENGFEGCALSQIIKASQVNQRMVYHYFGSKEGLYRAVFEHQWLMMKKDLEETMLKTASQGDARETLSMVLNVVSEYMANNQDFVRLMMWEALEGGRISISLWKDVRGPLFIGIKQIIDNAKAMGFLNPKIDAAHLIISFLGAISFYFSYAATLEDMLGRSPLSQSAIKERGQQLTFFLEALYLK